MTGREHDDEFEAYLKSRRPIHQSLSSLERLEPSEELDRLIIGKARRAIQNPAPVRVFRGPRWAVPVGLAAALVISFTVLLNLGVHKATPQGVPTETIDERAPSPPMRDKPVAAPKVTIPAAALSAKRSAARAAAPAAGTSGGHAPAPTAGPAAAPADIPARTTSTALADTVNVHVPAQTADSLGRADAPPALTEPTTPPDAATWLKRIEKLRAEGQTAEAEREFKRFRDVYPDYEPPAEPPPADGPTK